MITPFSEIISPSQTVWSEPASEVGFGDTFKMTVSEDTMSQPPCFSVSCWFVRVNVKVTCSSFSLGKYCTSVGSDGFVVIVPSPLCCQTKRS